MARTAISFSTSTPVANPLLSHRNTRSSKTTLPVAPGANGQPPRHERAVEDSHTCVERGGCVRDAHTARVVQMDTDRLWARELDRRSGQIADLPGPGIADGVGDADRIGA